MAKKFERRDHHQAVTAKIIEDLEGGTFPWAQPWDAKNVNAAIGMPRNAISDKSYSGINVLLLWGEVIQGEYSSQRWLTFKQARQLGGSVVKGASGTKIFYADRYTPPAERERAAQAGEDPKSVAFLKQYAVFNVDQCKDLPESAYQTPAPLPACEVVPVAEAFIKATEADFRIGGSKAFYVPSEDFIRVPPQPTFEDQINYYRTCFHELGHWTGHRTRLDRDQLNKKRSKPYAFEELIAELVAAFTCADFSIIPTVRHADYIGSWLEVLREDKKAIFRAASQASKAANFLLDLRPSEDQEAVA